MDLAISNDLRNKVAESLPNIDPAILDITISLDSKESNKYADKNTYFHIQSNKIYALNHFLYLIEIYNEIRYAAISAECCRELCKEKEASKEDIYELIYRFKFYVDSVVYRYYSFWEITGRFFNEYFDLKLDVNPKNYDKEKGFYFSREVLDRVTRDFDHKLLVDVLTFWEKSKTIFDYRIIKTHTRNTRIGEEILKLTKEIKPNGRTLKFDVGKDFSIDDLRKLLVDAYDYARLTIGIIRNLFELKPNEIEALRIKKEEKSHIIVPDNKTILQFQKIIQSDGLIKK